MQYSRIGDVIEGKKLDCKIKEVNSTFSPIQQPDQDPKCNTDMLIIDDVDIQRKFSALKSLSALSRLSQDIIIMSRTVK